METSGKASRLSTLLKNEIHVNPRLALAAAICVYIRRDGD